MAKRIRVKNNPPRGLSKAERMHIGLDREWDAGYRKHYNNPLTASGPHVSEVLRLEDALQDDPRFKGGTSKPSSTRKKRVKEGSRKFIGPRQLSSELNEDYDSVTRRAGGLDRDLKRGVKKIRGAEDESEPISNNDEIYRRIGEMILRRVRSRRV